MNALNNNDPDLDVAALDSAITPLVSLHGTPEVPRGPQKRDLIAGLEKGLSVISAFDQDRTRLTMSEVAALCGLTRAAARRYLITLEHLGYVTSERKMYSLTPKVLRLGQSYLHSARLPRIVQPELHKLASALKEASCAGVLDGTDVVCIAATNAGRVVSTNLQTGARVPAYCTSIGRVLVASMPQSQVDAWLAKQTFSPITPNTITSHDRLRLEIARIRNQGYAVVDQELEPGLRTISVALKSHRGDVIGAMNVSAHAARMTLDQLVDDCLPALLHSQATLRAVL